MTISGKRVKKRWMLLFAAITAISVAGLFASPAEGLFDLPNDNIWANIAWMITATIFVLMMTPGLSFFYGGMVRAKNVISTMLQSFIVMGVVSVIAYTFVMSYALYWLTDKMIPMRVSRHSEEIGLDRSQHDEEYGAEATTELAEENAVGLRLGTLRGRKLTFFK